MKKKQRKRESSPREIRPAERLWLRLPGIFIGAFIALYPVMCFPVRLRLTEAELMFVPNNGGVLTDLCVRSREILLFAAGLILILYWLEERVFPDVPVHSRLMEKRARFPLICTGLLLLAAVISGAFSLHPELCFWGISSENCGIAAAVGCGALFLAAYDSGSITRLYDGAAVSGLLCGAMLLAERLSGQQLAHLLWGVPESSGAMLLFGNSTACGEYGALLFPIILAGAFKEEKGSRARVIVSGLVRALAAGAALCTALLSLSSAAFYGVAAELAVMAVFGAGRAVKNRRLPKRVYLAALAVLPAVVLIAAAPEVLGAGAGNRIEYSPEESWGLTWAELSGGELRLSSADEAVTITVEPQQLVLTDVSGDSAVLTSRAPSAEIAGISARLTENILTLDLGYSEPLRFLVHKGELGYIGLNGYIRPLEQGAFPEHSELYGAFTGRGYIWLNTLPLLRDCLIKGVGAGQFCFYYPQSDIVGALNTHGTANLLTDRPHSMYLGLAAAGGIPALLVFLALAAAVMWRGSTAAVRGASPAGLVAACAGFLIMGAVNDLSVIYCPLAAVAAGFMLSENAQ